MASGWRPLYGDVALSGISRAKLYPTSNISRPAARHSHQLLLLFDLALYAGDFRQAAVIVSTLFREFHMYPHAVFDAVLRVMRHAAKADDESDRTELTATDSAGAFDLRLRRTLRLMIEAQAHPPTRATFMRQWLLLLLRDGRFEEAQAAAEEDMLQRQRSANPGGTDPALSSTLALVALAEFVHRAGHASPKEAFGAGGPTEEDSGGRGVAADFAHWLTGPSAFDGTSPRATPSAASLLGGRPNELHLRKLREWFAGGGGLTVWRIGGRSSSAHYTGASSFSDESSDSDDPESPVVLPGTGSPVQAAAPAAARARPSSLAAQKPAGASQQSTAPQRHVVFSQFSGYASSSSSSSESGHDGGGRDVGSAGARKRPRQDAEAETRLLTLLGGDDSENEGSVDRGHNDLPSAVAPTSSTRRPKTAATSPLQRSPAAVVASATAAAADVAVPPDRRSRAGKRSSGGAANAPRPTIKRGRPAKSPDAATLSALLQADDVTLDDAASRVAAVPWLKGLWFPSLPGLELPAALDASSALASKTLTIGDWPVSGAAGTAALMPAGAFPSDPSAESPSDPVHTRWPASATVAPKQVVSCVRLCAEAVAALSGAAHLPFPLHPRLAEQAAERAVTCAVLGLWLAGHPAAALGLNARALRACLCQTEESDFVIPSVPLGGSVAAGGASPLEGIGAGSFVRILNRLCCGGAPAWMDLRQLRERLGSLLHAVPATTALPPPSVLPAASVERLRIQLNLYAIVLRVSPALIAGESGALAMSALRTSFSAKATDARKPAGPRSSKSDRSSSESSSTSSYSSSESSPSADSDLALPVQDSDASSDASSAAGGSGGGGDDSVDSAGSTQQPKVPTQLPVAILVCAVLCALAGGDNSADSTAALSGPASTLGQEAAPSSQPRCSLSEPELRVLESALTKAGAALEDEGSPPRPRGAVRRLTSAGLASRAAALLCALLGTECASVLVKPPAPVASLADFAATAALLAVTPEARFRHFRRDDSPGPGGPRAAAVQALVAAIAAGCAPVTQ